MSSINGLKAPFNPSDVEFRPGTTTRDKTKAVGLAYVDKRVYEERLDNILGVDGWSVEYRTITSNPMVSSQTVEKGTRQSNSKDYWGFDDNVLKNLPESSPMKYIHWEKTTSKYSGSVIARLSIYVGERIIVREDVGDFNPEDMATYPTAVAQAFKRACAGFGLGRYLYSLPEVWAEYDQQKRKFTDAGMQVLRASLSRSMAQDKPAPAKVDPQVERLIKRVEDLLTQAKARDIEVEMPENWRSLGSAQITHLGMNLSEALK